MEKLTLLTGLVTIIMLVTVIQTAQLISLSQKVPSTGAVIAKSNGAIDTSEMTENEKMNYEMHGTIPARFGSGSALEGLPQQTQANNPSGLQSLPNQVGGC